MDNKKFQIMLGALLHDIGKIIIRGNPGRINHSAAGADYLRQYMPEEKDVLQAVANHHANELKKLKSTEDDISYIVYEADNIASSTDRRPNGEDNSQAFSAKVCLENIFNSYQSKGNGATSFPVKALKEKDKTIYPKDKGNYKASESDYQELIRLLDNNFKQCSPERMQINELLQVIEVVSSYVPSSTATNEIADISLYDHLRLTTALAASLYDYFEENDIKDYKSYCYGNRQAECRSSNTYLLASGDLSGIQQFIYTIPTKGALKSLRGRSFYLEILLENIIDDILEELSLSRANLLYTGGGNFYMLLPNTEKAKSVLSIAQQKVNDWFLKTWGTSLYLAIGYAECCADDFKAGTDNRLGKLYPKVRNELSKDKHSRYNVDQLNDLFYSNSLINKTLDGSRECGICHTSSSKLVPYEKDKDTLACPACAGLRKLGEKLLTGDVLAIFNNGHSEQAMPLPGLYVDMELSVFKEEEADKQCREASRIYVKNKMLTGGLMATRLWMGDYFTKNAKGQAMEFEELAAMSGGSLEESGIKRLGVMRADVDNLGASFMAGFSKDKATFGRNTALSRQLSMFFKSYVNRLCAGEIDCTDINEKFSLFATPKEKARKLHIIYSGGDDVFIVGAWDELIELAVDLRKAFAVYTNNKLSYSAGIAFLPDKCPVAEMARQSGKLEDFAKKAEEKNSIALFGSSTEQKGIEELDINRFSWNRFIDGVCTEKLGFLKKHLGYAGNENPARLEAGKGVLYRMLELIRTADERVNLARFAYVLARLNPGEKNQAYGSYNEIRKQFYKWYQSADDRLELEAAIELVIYRIRAKG